MTTQEQIDANKKNSLFSTGANTEEGKAIVAKNAVKHGIFTKELIIEYGDGKESQEEYEELFQNLIEYFDPQGQLEVTLVEKIAVDMWRLKRVIRYETGTIRKHLDIVIQDFVDGNAWSERRLNKSNRNAEDEVKQLKAEIDWNTRYLENLRNGCVDVSKDKWQGEGIECDLLADYYLITLAQLTKKGLVGVEIKALLEQKLNFLELRTIFQSNGHDDQSITCMIIEYYEEKIAKSVRLLDQLEFQTRLAALPLENEIDKILRYERSIERSIFQKIIVLKNLQGKSS